MQRAASPSPDPRRRLPSVESLLASPSFAPLAERFSRPQVKQEVVRWLSELRSGGEIAVPSVEDAAREIESRIAARHSSALRRVVNATGVLIHTNLGRAPIASAIWAETESLMRYSNLEFDLGNGERGKRDALIAPLARELFGCEDALIVNNNAAAVMLLLAANTKGKEVIVSRGELVEIGGSFRIPEIIEQGGAKLREVGTTNRTRAADYAEACSRRTAAMLSVHQSNFQIVGFTEAPSTEELVAISKQKRVPLFVDEGSGRVVDLAQYGLATSPTVRELIERGVDAVTSSTDKLIGATQGGLILGKREIVQRCAKHPLMRALRAGKESYAVVAATLKAFLRGRHEEEITLYRMLAQTIEQLRSRAARLSSTNGVLVIETRAVVGGGTTPGETLPSIGVEIGGNANELARRFRAMDPPIIGTIDDDRFRLDLRTIDPDDDAIVAAAVRAISPSSRE
jgi:L-seryl-tRNA(Ser) seleniumtransferase